MIEQQVAVEKLVVDAFEENHIKIMAGDDTFKTVPSAVAKQILDEMIEANGSGGLN